MDLNILIIQIVENSVCVGGKVFIRNGVLGCVFVELVSRRKSNRDFLELV
jgi:hypothetical protein